MTETLDKPFMRTIKSFVLREGRMTKGQQRAMDELFPRWGVPSGSDALLFNELFGNANPVVLEIGFGMGRSLVEQAVANPERNYLGIEVHRPGVGAALVLAEEKGVENLRVANEDAVELLKTRIPDQSLAGVQIYFPDPWHKKKHHKRRIVQSDFIDRLHSKIQSGGFLHLATDWQHYAEHMLDIMRSVTGWVNQSPSQDYVERPEHRPLTKFEHRGHRLGHGVWDLMFIRD